jgi:hypothetical protein
MTRHANHYDGVAGKKGVDECLAKEHAVRHVFDPSSIFVADVLEADSISDLEDRVTDQHGNKQ